MAMIIKPSSAIIGFGVREGFLTLADKLLLRPSRPQRLLDHLLAHVPPGDPAAIIAAMDEFACKQRFLMNVGDVKGRILVKQLQASGAGNVLELGTFCGYSAILMGQYLVGSGHIDSLEKNPATATVARRIIEHAGLSDVVTVHEGAAADIIPTLDKVYQLVFIDHWKDQYLPDLLAIEAHGVTAPGTIVVADNVGMFEAGGYLSHVRSCGRYDNTHYDTHMEYSDTIYDAVEVSVVRAET
jgi:catechol O-methyltransferase